MLSRLSIRARITIGSVLVAAVLFAFAIIAVRAQVTAVLTNADATLAQSDLSSFQKDILAHPSAEVDDPGTGVLVLVVSPDGRSEVNTLPHDVFAITAHRSADNAEFTTTDDEGRTFVVAGRLVSTSGGEWTLWAARSTAASELAVRGLDALLIVGGLLLLAAFGVASWLLASAALRPVSRLRREAEKLGADVSRGALPVGPARDEIAALATTLNAFIDRVRAGTDREKQMVSDAAHELRTPLAALKTQLELAHDDFGNADALAAELVTAEESVDRLSSLASNLLELSRLESAELATRSSGSQQLVSELMGSVDRARMIGLAKRADVTFSIDSERDATYAVAEDAFGRLCDNLLANALAAIDRGGSVNVSLADSGDSLVLEVRDDGPGMPPTFLAQAFDRFSRPDDSRTSSTGGSGLGLALVKATAAAAGGTAQLHNTNPGLSVRVTLPKM
ncbi:MAG: HAMP domain-containing sensor histidine kinase [Rhodoglobus sp.]